MNNVDTICNYGKFTGQKWSDIPEWYLKFIAKNGGVIKNKCLDELEKRGIAVKLYNM